MEKDKVKTESEITNKPTLNGKYLIAVIVIQFIALGWALGTRTNSAKQEVSNTAHTLETAQTASTFEECVEYGDSLEDEDPDTCTGVDGRVFLAETKDNLDQEDEVEPVPSEEPEITPEQNEEATTPTVVLYEDCSDFTHDMSASAAEGFEEVLEGFVGEWQGCVTTPWTNPFEVTVTFNEDGSYSAKRLDTDDPEQVRSAFYYGSDDDSTLKQYEIETFQDNGKARGNITIYFDPTSTNEGDLRDIELTGNTLRFEFWHRYSYGPLVYNLVRVDQAETNPN